jgi:hypothetical protein
MALDPHELGHDLGRDAPGIVLREIEGVEGAVTFDMEFAPRPEYGRVRPFLAEVDGGLLVRGGAYALALSFRGRCIRVTRRLRRGSSFERANG